MRRWAAIAVLGAVLVASVAHAGELEAGFRSPPKDCMPSRGWAMSQAVAATLAKAPEEVGPALLRALAEGGVSIAPEEIKRIATWQALVDASVIASAKPEAPPAAKPFAAWADTIHAYLARLVYLCSKTQADGGIFTQAKSAHGITIYPPPPEQTLFLARRRLGETDVYLAVSQAQIPTAVTITFPRVAAPELWDPEDGSIRTAPTYHADGGKTMLNLRLGPYQALFVVLRKPPTKAHVTFASSMLEVTSVAADGSAVTGLARLNGRCSAMFADGTMGMATVEALPPPLPVEAGWSMKTRTPAKRLGVGIVALRCKRADLEAEKSAKWAAPDLDDADWTPFVIGESKPPSAVVSAPWQAEWLRMHGNNEERLYRKTFELAEEPDLATVTLSGDNGYELFVNGQKLGADGTWSEAETYDARKALRKGTNVFAVRLTNQGDVGALILESRIRLASGKLLRIVTDATWKMTEKAPEGWQKADFDDAAWGKPEPAGKPPVPPWGDVPGLPPDPMAGESVWYRFRLPSGAKSVAIPQGAREPRLFVGGKEVPLKDASADLAGDVQARPRVAALRTLGFATLDRPILCECSDTAVGVGSWLLVGYPTYSGLADYTVEVDLPDAYRKEHLVLDLGDVGCAAQVAVNGKDLGVRAWRPYAFDLSGALRPGRNAIQVTVANTAANAAKAELPAERLAAGLIGPVRIRCLREVTIQAK